MAHLTNREGTQSLLDGGCLYLARIFRIQRRDGAVLRLTEHDSEFTVREGYIDGGDEFSGDEVYTPLAGINASAVRSQAGMKESPIEMFGMITSDLITDEDLRSEKYVDSVVDIAWLDWRAPWLGVFRHQRFRLTDFLYDEDTWTAQAVSLMSELNRQSGKRYAKTCWHAFMDEQCGVARVNGTTVFPSQAVRVVTTNSDFEFEAGVSYDAEGEVDDFFKAGHVRWITGDNAGQVYPVLYSREATTHTPSDARIVLQFPTRADIAAGDTFDLYAGCDRKIETCASTSLGGGVDNHLRFGGSPHMPGASRLTKTGLLEV